LACTHLVSGLLTIACARGMAQLAAAVFIASIAWAASSSDSGAAAVREDAKNVTKSRPAITELSHCGVERSCKPEWTSATAGEPHCPPEEYQLLEGGVVIPCTGAAGKVPLTLRRGEKLTIVSLPAGAEGIKVIFEGRSGVDLDTHIVDDTSGKCIIGPGCTFDQQVYKKAYKGMKITYTGDSSFARFEQVEVYGKTTRPLTIQVVGASAGKGSVEYWIGNYEASACPAPAVGCGLCPDYSCPISGEVPVACDGTPAVQCAATTTTATTTTAAPTTTTSSRRRRRRDTTTPCPWDPQHLPEEEEEGEPREGGQQKKAEFFLAVGHPVGSIPGGAAGGIGAPWAVAATTACFAVLAVAGVAWMRTRRSAPGAARAHTLLASSGDDGGNAQADAIE